MSMSVVRMYDRNIVFAYLPSNRRDHHDSAAGIDQSQHTVAKNLVLGCYSEMHYQIRQVHSVSAFG